MDDGRATLPGTESPPGKQLVSACMLEAHRPRWQAHAPLPPGRRDEPEHPDEVNTDAIHAQAKEAFGKLNGGPLPRYSEVEKLRDELRKSLRTLVDDLVVNQSPDGSTWSAVVEALYWLEMPIGDGLQSAADCTRNLADVTMVVSGMHRRMVKRP